MDYNIVFNSIGLDMKALMERNMEEHPTLLLCAICTILGKCKMLVESLTSDVCYLYPCLEEIVLDISKFMGELEEYASTDIIPSCRKLVKNEWPHRKYYLIKEMQLLMNHVPQNGKSC